MASETLDITGLKKERVEYLKNLVDLWKRQDGQDQQTTNGTKLPQQDIVFATHKSRVLGELTRADAYDD